MRSRNFFALRHYRVDNFLLSTLYTKRRYYRALGTRGLLTTICLQVLDEKQTSRRIHWRTAAHGDKLATGLRYRAPRQVTAASYTTLSLARAASPHHPRKRARKRPGVNERKTAEEQSSRAQGRGGCSPGYCRHKHGQTGLRNFPSAQFRSEDLSGRAAGGQQWLRSRHFSRGERRKQQTLLARTRDAAPTAAGRDRTCTRRRRSPRSGKQKRSTPTVGVGWGRSRRRSAAQPRRRQRPGFPSQSSPQNQVLPSGSHTTRPQAPATDERRSTATTTALSAARHCGAETSVPSTSSIKRPKRK